MTQKNLLFVIFLFLFSGNAFSQSAGDTLIVPTFKYSQNYGVGIRDTLIQFPSGLTFEKIYMLYNLRCKKGLVSTGTSPEQGCGQWDYNCQTYLVDSSKIDSVKATAPDYVISGFTGNPYNYTTQPTYTYYKYNQKQVVHSAVISETVIPIGTSSITSNSPFNTAKKSSKSQYLWTAAELNAAGFTAGNISGLQLFLSNVGSNAQFLVIRIKPTTLTTLSAATPSNSGFTEVYNINTAFVNGMNQFNFHTNYAWNGTDNLIVEFSFTNNSIGTDNLLLSQSTPLISGLVTTANDYNFEFSGNNLIQLANTNFTSISSKITISFWSNGNPDFLPTNTSVLYGTNAARDRQLNVHLPWSNGAIFWDAGGAGNYDRCSKTADSTAQYKGKWNHWTFTKNTATGIMNIYVNGILFKQGTAKTIPMIITQLFLGADPDLLNPYFGKIDEFSVWNTELTQPTIQNWMYKKISSLHPNYANLFAYYSLNEGTGTTCADSSLTASNASVTVGLPKWNLFRGIDIFKNFEETTNRPLVAFVSGVYTQTITPIQQLDSIPNIQNTVYHYGVNGTDLVRLDTNFYFKAGYEYVYNGNTGAVIDSINVSPTGSKNISTLNYYTKSISRLQLMSFVTPYGINLDLGANGKTWTFDVSDFAPVLNGKKRLQVDAGGQWQEDMDLKFMFIVGTPPRNVREIKNIWKVESVGYANILNDLKFEPRTVKLDAAASAFKIRTVISGHGQEGEFIPQTHFLNIQNSGPQFTWDVSKLCGENPIYPQGGTWLYDRAGWCPGMATNLQESMITPYVTPGANTVIDYGLNTASGTSNYWVSNQLVSYGNPNFVLDAAITDIKNPSNKVEYARSNSVCSQAKISFKNTGSTTLTSVVFEYWVNNNSQTETYTWNGSLASMESVDITLPTPARMWTSLNGPNNNTFYVQLKSPNNGTDAYSFNNKMASKFNITPVLPANFVMNFKTNNAASENKYELFNANGVSVFVKNGMSNATLYKDTFHLTNGCYQLVISDAGGNGIDFWANAAAGKGTANITTVSGTNLVTFQPDFGSSLIYNFTIDFPLSYEEIAANLFYNVYPNPAKKQFLIEGADLENTHFQLFNSLGQLVEVSTKLENNSLKVNCTSMAEGVYTVVLTAKNGLKTTKKIILE